MRKTGRTRGQRGHLYQNLNGSSWMGRWYVYEGAKRVRQSMALGSCEEMSKAEARRRLLELVRRTNSEAHALASIGAESTIPQLRKLESLLPAKSGSISELLVCADLMAKGWDVYRAMDATCACDLMCVKGSSIVRIEVKTGTRERSRLLRLHTKIGKFDVLALVDGADLHYFAYHQLGDLKNPNLVWALDEIEQSSGTSRTPDPIRTEMETMTA